ncbi:MAG: Calx-beta domain-containing protein [Tepidisphaeraceae bacterium]
MSFATKRRNRELQLRAPVAPPASRRAASGSSSPRNPAMRCERLEDRRLLSVAPVYSTNFDSGTLDPEWSPPSAYNYWEGWGNMYIQGNNSITLSLSDLDPHTDVAINYMMNGLMMERFGQSLGDPETHMGDEDVFEVSVDGDVVLRFTATFTPYLDEGFWYPDREIEYEYFNGAWFNPEGALCVPHAGSSLEIEFKASQLEPELDYEEWQLDDVAVSAYQPTVTIAAADATADEDGNTGQFTVTRDANPFRQDPYDGNLTVNLAEPTGDAEEGVDYETLPDTVTIDDGDASAAPLIVMPLVDQIVEGAEDVGLTLASGSAYAVGTPNTAIVTLAAQTYKNLEYSDIQADGASSINRKTIAAGPPQNFDSIIVYDNNDNKVNGTLMAEAKPSGGGAVVPGITVTFTQVAAGTQRAVITVGGTVAPGNYNIKVWLDEDPTKTIFIYITV